MTLSVEVGRHHHRWVDRLPGRNLDAPTDRLPCVQVAAGPGMPECARRDARHGIDIEVGEPCDAGDFAPSIRRARWHLVRSSTSAVSTLSKRLMWLLFAGSD
ncbi:hypothetical protein [Rhodococcus jostii]|uniref:hypothetical protein n=1 Tax=Rhodococcus jostii TaxID=132919 RepID=UPI0013C32533|nr:hypothetical protein [Rhodococcus jostii]